MTGLIIDHGDRAQRVRAERILRGRVRDTPRPQRADVPDGPIRSTLYLVQRAAVGRIQRPNRAVRGGTRRMNGGIRVTRQHPPGGAGRATGARARGRGSERGGEHGCRDRRGRPDSEKRRHQHSMDGGGTVAGRTLAVPGRLAVAVAAARPALLGVGWGLCTRLYGPT